MMVLIRRRVMIMMMIHSSDHDRDIQQDDQFGFCLNTGVYLESDDSKRLNDAFFTRDFWGPTDLGIP